VLFRGVQVDGAVVDVRISLGRISAIGHDLAADSSSEVVAGEGGALIPGLHDHHLHLLATAALATSVVAGPPSITSAEQLRLALNSAPGEGWVRGVGYDESVAGELDRHGLDALIDDRPVRVQHRGGSLWILNSPALDCLGPGGPPDGRLWRRDEWLRERLAEGGVPSLTELGRRLASYGITGVTDATPSRADGLDASVWQIPQRVHSLGDTTGTRLTAGARKLVLADHALPTYDEVVRAVRSAHEQGRPVAVHCVTRVSLLLLLAVLDDVGALPGDRVEHAAIAPPEAVHELARLGVAVVTQPSLVATRGDDYWTRVDPDDRRNLWRYRSFCAAGIAVACSSDAPYGELDPWASIRAAHDRRTAHGRVLGPGERVDALVALEGFLREPGNLGAGRKVAVGATADLILLDGPLGSVLSDPRADRVRMTMIAGRTVHERNAGVGI